MAISKTHIKGTSMGVLITSMLTVLFIPVSASAAVPNATYTSKDDCKTRLSKYKVDELKTYGDKRIDSRTKSLDKYGPQTDAFYTKQEARIKKYEDSHKRTTGANSNISSAYLKANQTSFKKELSDTSTKMKGFKTTLDSSKDSSKSAEAICSVMYDLRINTYVRGKMQHLRMIDSSRTTATINNIRISESTKLYEKRQARYKTPDSARELYKSLPKSLEYEQQFVAVTDKLNKITPASINGNSPPTANAEFLGYLPELNTLTQNVKTQTGKISKIRSDFKKEKLNPVKKPKKKTTTTTNSTTSGGSSSGGGG